MNAFENTEKVLCSALGARRSISYLNDFFLPILAPARRWKRDQDGASLQLSPELIRMLSNATISNSFIPSLRKIRSKYQLTALSRNSPIYTKKRRIPNAQFDYQTDIALFAWNWHKKEFFMWSFPLVSGKYPVHVSTDLLWNPLTSGKRLLLDIFPGNESHDLCGQRDSLRVTKTGNTLRAFELC